MEIPFHRWPAAIPVWIMLNEERASAELEPAAHIRALDKKVSRLQTILVFAT